MVVTISLCSLSGSWSYSLTNGISGFEGDSFNSVAISEDGNYVVALTESDKLLLFKKTSNVPLWQFNEGFRIRNLAISSNGSFIVAGSSEGQVYLFNRSYPIPIWIYDFGVEYSVENLIISSNDKYIVAGASTMEPNSDLILVFEDLNPLPKWNVPGNHFAVSNDFKFISVTDSIEISLYHMFNSTPIWSFDSGIKSLTRLAISTQGEFVAAIDPVAGLQVFDNLSSTPKWYFKSPDNMERLEISVDGLIACGSTGGLYMFNQTSSTPLWFFDLGCCYSLDFNENGKFLVAGVLDRIYLFTPLNPVPLWTGPNSIYTSISSDGKSITSAYYTQMYYFNVDNPLIVENFFLFYYINFSILGLLSASFSIKFIRFVFKQKKARKQEQVQKEDLQKIIEYSNRISKKVLRTILGMNKSDFTEKLPEIIDEFGLQADEDYIYLNEGEVSNFVKDLDKKFEEWNELKKKEG